MMLRVEKLLFYSERGVVSRRNARGSSAVTSHVSDMLIVAAFKFGTVYLAFEHQRCVK